MHQTLEVAMRRRRVALVVLTAALLSVLVAGPAAAGGPTSALLVVPGTGQTASLYTGDPDYEALAGLVGAFEPDGAAGTVDESGATHGSGPGVTVTWLIHDVQVWRIDRIFADAQGGPWISTQLVAPGSADPQPVWHTATDGPALTRLLDRLGLSAPAAFPDTSGALTEQPAADVAPPATESLDAGTSGAAALTWGIVLGVAGSMAVIWLVRIVRSSRGSRAAAADTDPVVAPDAEPRGEVDWAGAEELAWPAKR
ncbi:MAG: hypothetical protein ACRDXB_05445 [Actinomycetes bacterium]